MASYNGVDEAFRAARESLEYDPQILTRVTFEWGRVELVLIDRVTRELERGFEEKPVEIWPPCCLPVGGNQSHCHILTKHFPKQSWNASD